MIGMTKIMGLCKMNLVGSKEKCLFMGLTKLPTIPTLFALSI
jgi:hypothetical protein